MHVMSTNIILLFRFVRAIHEYGGNNNSIIINPNVYKDLRSYLHNWYCMLHRRMYAVHVTRLTGMHIKLVN
jgi:hypothetical protein